MGFREKLDIQRLFKGALLLGAIALAWKFEKPGAMTGPAVGAPASDWFVDPAAAARAPSLWRMPWSWWRGVFLDTYDAMSKDRLLAVAAGVVFYALLAIFPAITALVSCYGLFAKASAVQDDLSMLSSMALQHGAVCQYQQRGGFPLGPAGIVLFGAHMGPR